MDRESIDSTLIASIGYDPATGQLDVELKPKGVFTVPSVTPEKYAEFRAAPSLGSYYNRFLRPLAARTA